MMAQNHLLMGAIFGLYLNNPYIIAIISLISHFVMDLFPFYILKNRSGEATLNYYDSLSKDIKYFTRMIMALQFVLILFVFAILYQKNFLLEKNVLIGMLFAVLPDLTKYFLLLFGINWKHHEFFIKVPRDVHTIIHTVVTLVLILLIVFY